MKVGSRLETLLTQGEFVATAELGPPKSADIELIKKKAAILRGYADAVNITDNQTAIVRVSSIAAGKISLDEGLEPIIQMTCRDRNRLAPMFLVSKIYYASVEIIKASVIIPKRKTFMILIRFNWLRWLRTCGMKRYFNVVMRLRIRKNPRS